ncbi:MAG: Na/Pi symporter [Euzebyales bacterium]|nr:Na/Pi symporter [Euzebyales bacterium]
MRIVVLIALLYGFLAAVDILGAGIGGLGRDFTDQLFEGVANPLVGLLVGVLATVLAQSSSVTTATLVGLVGAGVLDLNSAVPVIMGANVGTTITNTLASLGSIRRVEEFRRAFTGATMHDVFNLLCVAVLLPLEITTGMLARSATALSGLFGNVATGDFDSPAKALVESATGLVGAAVARLPFSVGAQATILVGIGLVLIFATLVAITRTMKKVIAGPAERSLNRVLGRSGALGILVGLALTVSVQSSSIATSLLVPLIAAGVLSLENAYPITLGSNLGTTITALLAAMAVDRIEGLQIALVHLLFNTVGILLFYPVHAMRRVPLALAVRLASFAAKRRALAIVYVVVGFYVIPLVGILVLR